EVLPLERNRIGGAVFDLIAECIIEVGRGKHITRSSEILLEPSLERTILLRLEGGVRYEKWRAGKGLLQAPLFEACGIGKAQARAGERPATAESKQGQSDTRDAGVAEVAVVDEARARDGGETLPDDLLLAIDIVVYAMAMCRRWEVRIADEPV